MGKNIVILSGSPRRNGNSEQLVSKFKEGAESAGNTVTVFRPAFMQFSGCTGCGFCQKNQGTCTLKDDMTQALAALVDADVIVWASPVYYFSVSGQLKLAIDRMFPLTVGSPKKLALLMTCADETSDTAAGALEIFHKTREYNGWEDAGVIIATGVHEINDIAGHDALGQAWRLGQGI